MSEAKRSWLTPGKAALLMLGIGTAALMGIPGMVAYEPPTGALTGIVLDPAGDVVVDVPVALFDGDGLDMLEVTHTDEAGRFAFQHAPPVYHVLARPDAATDLVPTWLLSLQKPDQGEIELVLEPGRPVTVSVTDEAGRPIEGAEVRAYDLDSHRGESAVVVRILTDADGEASFPCPERAHIGVLGHEHDYLSGWRFDQSIPAAGDTYHFSLPAGAKFHGTVLGSGRRPLSGILVSSWDQRGDEWQWNGYELTDADGRFDLVGVEDHTVIRAVDLMQGYLPLQIPAERGLRTDVVLARGEPLEIHCRDPESEGVPSRVWVWSQEGGTWSWGTRTNQAGTLHATVSDVHAVVARPIHGGLDTTAEVWNRTYEEGALELTHELEDGH